MVKLAVPRGVRKVDCGCLFVREKGKFVGVVTCKEHTFRTLVTARPKPRKRRRALD
jgi:hypothetical protein